MTRRSIHLGSGTRDIGEEGYTLRYSTHIMRCVPTVDIGLRLPHLVPTVAKRIALSVNITYASDVVGLVVHDPAGVVDGGELGERGQYGKPERRDVLDGCAASGRMATRRSECGW